LVIPTSLIIMRYLRKLRILRFKMQTLDNTNKKLFSLLSHDIRSPIATLKTVVELLQEKDLSTQDGEYFLHKVSGEIDHVLDFLHDIFLWSKNQTQNQILELDVVSCKSVISNITTLYTRNREEKEIELDLENVGEHQVFVDNNSYTFVVRNVFQNAIKFTPKNGKISISTALIDGQVHTIIEDSGVGIPKEDISKILDESQWFTKRGTENEKGTGFGVTASVYYMRINNGELLIDSQEDKGTKVSIILPNGAIKPVNV